MITVTWSTHGEDERHLRQAIAHATANVACGGYPSASLLVVDGTRPVVHVAACRAGGDWSACSSMEAIAQAAEARAGNDRSRATIYSSCEPCSLCRGAAVWAGVSRIVFAMERRALAAFGFSDPLAQGHWDWASGGVEHWSYRPLSRSERPFVAFSERLQAPDRGSTTVPRQRS